MKWENLSKLLAIVNDQLTQFGSFVAQLDFGFDQRQNIDARSCRILSLQRGVMRTNCMDNLDRTNVVQGVFSRKIALQ